MVSEKREQKAFYLNRNKSHQGPVHDKNRACQCSLSSLSFEKPLPHAGSILSRTVLIPLVLDLKKKHKNSPEKVWQLMSSPELKVYFKIVCISIALIRSSQSGVCFFSKTSLCKDIFEIT